MSKPKATYANVRSALIWAAAGLLELPLAFMAAGVHTRLPAGWAAALHAASAALLFFAPPREKGWFLPTRHWGEPFVMGALCLPVFGWAAAGWFLWSSGETTQHKEAYRFDVDSPEGVSPLAALGTPQAIRRDLADALEVLPAADALLSHDPALKRGAIETLARIRTPDSIAWILRARTDSDPEVRFYATSALTRLKGEFDTGIRAAERESIAHPADPALRLAVYRVRYEYAASGMLDAPARKAMLEECRDRLAGPAERSPDAARLAWLVEKALDPRNALPYLDRLEARDPARSGRWLRDRVELLFELGRPADVAALLRARKDEALAAYPGDREWASAVLWWAGS